MRNFRASMARFMYGRYGVDKLYYALLVLYVIMIIPAMIFKIRVIYWIGDALLLYMFFRVFSRNIYKRQQENYWFTKKWARFTDFRTHVYHTCPNCKATLRFPRKAGKFPVVCPRCNHHFNIRNWL